MSQENPLNQQSGQAQGNPGHERKHDLFQDPALARSLEEDPVAAFIVKRWKNLLVAVIAVIGFFLPSLTASDHG